jgi:hypothetical protein
VTSLAWPATAKDTHSGQAPDGKTFELVVTLDSAPATGRVTFRLTPRAGQTCRVRIEHSGLRSADEVHASVKGWQSALNGIGRLMATADKSRRRERQAVIVVHGIGEQRPGQLLRQFVTNVFDRAAGEVHFVKPDYVASLFEMRMATVPRNDETRPTTDVYELYWAHLIRDTTVAQVYGWMFRLMTSRDDKIPRTLIHLVWGSESHNRGRASGLCLADDQRRVRLAHGPGAGFAGRPAGTCLDRPEGIPGSVHRGVCR